MFRPRYLASFLCAAALAAAGFAQGADAPHEGVEDAPRLDRGRQLGAAEPLRVDLEPMSSAVLGRAAERAALAASPAPSTTVPAFAWSERIDHKLQALAQRAHAPRGAARDGTALHEALERVLARSPHAGEIAIHVRDLDSEQVIFDRHGEHHLNPASNQKILTAHAAVELLGPDYRFETRVLRQGSRLVLVGEGDPLLELSDLHGLAAEVARKLGPAAGDIDTLVLDTSAFSSAQLAPGVAKHHGEAAYLAPTGALSLNFNTIEIAVSPGAKRGDPVRVETFPANAQIEVRNFARTHGGGLSIDSGVAGPSDDSESAHASTNKTVVEVHGGLALGAKPERVRRRIHDPARFTGHAFLSALEAQGVDTRGWSLELGSASSEARPLATYRSAPLVEVLASPMKFSNNFATEQVLRTLAWRATGQPGDWKHGREVLERFAAVVVHDDDALAFENGSGLSRRGRATPSALVDLIALADDVASPSFDLLSSYAAFGREGTLAHRLTQAHGRVRAKTGTLAGVSALSGIVSARDGHRRVAFSILVNGRHAQQSRATQDELVEAMLAWVESSAP